MPDLAVFAAASALLYGDINPLSEKAKPTLTMASATSAPLASHRPIDVLLPLADPTSHDTGFPCTTR